MLGRRSLLTLLVCGGCFSKPGFSAGSGGGSDGSIATPVCQEPGAWSARSELPISIPGSYEGNGALSRDGNTLIYTANHSGAGDDLYRAGWSTASSTYETEERLSVLDDGNDQSRAAFSGDETRLYVWNISGFQMSTITHTADGLEFGPLGPATGLVGLPSDIQGMRFSDDDTIAVYYTADELLGYATRSAPGGPWTEHRELVDGINGAPTGFGSVSMSGDALTIMYTVNGYRVEMATRTATTEHFTSNGSPIDTSTFDMADPELSRDGTRLVFTASDRTPDEDHLYLVTRPCLD